jgi:ABC transporter substrate binding protein
LGLIFVCEQLGAICSSPRSLKVVGFGIAIVGALRGQMQRREFITLLACKAAWPLAARAQQKAGTPVIGFLSLRSSAADLVVRKVDVIVTGGGNASALAAKGATSTIPIVFETGADPVETHLVTSFARPGGNLTGANILVAGLNPKRLELLSKLVPEADAIALLVNPNYSGVEAIMREVQEAARVKGFQLHILKAATENEIDAAFATFTQLRPGALVVANDPFFSTRREQLVALASRHGVPRSIHSVNLHRPAA